MVVTYNICLCSVGARLCFGSGRGHSKCFYFNGFCNVFASALGKKQLNAEDLGVIDNIAAELNSSGV